MTCLLLDSPKEDTLPSTLSRTDPNWEFVSDVASAHWGTWLSVGVSVLGFADSNFPPHNVRYDTIYTPLQDDIDRAVEFYPGGHDSPITTTQADALRAQGYKVRPCQPECMVYLDTLTVSIAAFYDGVIASGPYYNQYEGEVRHVESKQSSLNPVQMSQLQNNETYSFRVRVRSIDEVWSDWSESVTLTVAEGQLLYPSGLIYPSPSTFPGQVPV